MPEAQVWVGGNAGGLRLHFEHFQELGISQTFSLQKYFFLIEYFISQFFGNSNAGCCYLKRKKGRKNVVNPYYSPGLMHDDLCQINVC